MPIIAPWCLAWWLRSSFILILAQSSWTVTCCLAYMNAVHSIVQHFNVYENHSPRVLSYSPAHACLLLWKVSKLCATCTNTEKGTDRKRFPGMVYKHNYPSTKENMHATKKLQVLASLREAFLKKIRTNGTFIQVRQASAAPVPTFRSVAMVLG